MVAGVSALFDLSGHVALVTGGNGGIGLGMAEGLAAQGATVAIWGTNPDKNDAAVERLAAHGGDVYAAVCDVGDRDAVVRRDRRRGRAARADRLVLRQRRGPRAGAELRRR